MRERRNAAMKQAFQRVKGIVVGIAIVLALCVPARPLYAVEVEWTMKGTITFYADVGLDPWTNLKVGDEFTIRFRYDTDQDPSEFGPTVSRYEDAVSSGSFSVGGGLEEFSSPTQIELWHGLGGFKGGFLADAFRFQFTDMPSGAVLAFCFLRGYLPEEESTMFPNGDLPTSFNLEAFPDQGMALYKRLGPGSLQLFMNGEFTSVESVIIPAPSALCGLAIAALWPGRRGRA
jgi:hypothetical protein